MNDKSSDRPRLLGKYDYRTERGAATMHKFRNHQKSVHEYFTPDISEHGLLVWHDDGAERACTAISVASRNFVDAQYIVLWVCLEEKKPTYWHYQFKDVCNIKTQKKIASENDPGKLKRLNEDRPRSHKRYMRMNTSPTWVIAPISHAELAAGLGLQGPGGYPSWVHDMEMLHSKYHVDYDMVKKGINEVPDPFYKTLLVIDDAHKLMDVPGLYPELKNVLRSSYDKSGKHSAKVLLMTATPFAKGTTTFFNLINLLKTNDIPEPTATFNAESRAQFMESIENLVSHYERTFDPVLYAVPEVEYVIASLAKNKFSESRLKKIHTAIDLMKTKKKDENTEFEEIKTVLTKDYSRSPTPEIRQQVSVEIEEQKMINKDLVSVYESAIRRLNQMYDETQQILKTGKNSSQKTRLQTCIDGKPRGYTPTILSNKELIRRPVLSYNASKNAAQKSGFLNKLKLFGSKNVKPPNGSAPPIEETKKKGLFGMFGKT